MTFILAELGTIVSGKNPIEYSVLTPLVVSIGISKLDCIE
jgi:hypothetical protein